MCPTKNNFLEFVYFLPVTLSFHLVLFSVDNNVTSLCNIIANNRSKTFNLVIYFIFLLCDFSVYHPFHFVLCFGVILAQFFPVYFNKITNQLSKYFSQKFLIIIQISSKQKFNFYLRKA